MTRRVLKIYDWIRFHRASGLTALVVLTALVAWLVSRLDYSEEIADFLPSGTSEQLALEIYQQSTGTSQIIAIFQAKDDNVDVDADCITYAIEDFAYFIADSDTADIAGNMMAQIDLNAASHTTDFIYDNIPYFLTQADYQRIDSILAEDDAIDKLLANDKMLLMLPSGGLLSSNVGRDPLNLFTPVVESLSQQSTKLRYELYNGYIFSPDMSRAIATVNSPYGSSETEMNADLTKMLQACADSVMAIHDDIEVRLTGGPVVAVGNSTQIKHDSLLAVVLAALLIVALLLVTLKSIRNLILILVAVGWGWLVAMGGIALIEHRVSIIVIGISSAIVGIAVNYPLHYIAHLSHTPNKRNALREIVAPLIIGNITTVGAFAALVPLKSVALRDLGIFAAFLLIGTIIFSIICLPHLAATPPQHNDGNKHPRRTIIDRLSEISIESKPTIVWAVVVITIILGYFSTQATFNSDLSSINYITPQQRNDMEYLAKEMTTQTDQITLLAVATADNTDKALENNEALLPTLDYMQQSGLIADYSSCHRWICSQAEQQKRLDMWQRFVNSHSNLLEAIDKAATAHGFSQNAFSQFSKIFNAQYEPQPADYFSPLKQATTAIVEGKNGNSVVTTIYLADRGNTDQVKELIERQGAKCLDLANAGTTMAQQLSDNFNYIGWACGIIVFLFLWISFGSIELALISFVPMAVSWIWILGIMALTGLEFNIVNIILATFIFGQGDDYTIFMTEGACYEYAYRRRMLATYKRSIIISAIIMLIGIGTLIVAKHPALQSLAYVTIAGMASVVIMAAIFPPLLFAFLTKHKGNYRLRPLRIVPILRGVMATLIASVCLICAYVAALSLALLIPAKQKRQSSLMHLTKRLCAFTIALIPNLKIHYTNKTIILSNAVNEPNALGFTILMATANESTLPYIPKAGVLRPLARWIGCPHSPKFNEGGTYMYQNHIHGLEIVTPRDGIGIYSGIVTVVAPEYSSKSDFKYSPEQIPAIAFSHLVIDRYRYKGTEAFATVRRNLRHHNNYSLTIDSDLARKASSAVIVGPSWGEFALLFALVHPECHVIVANDDPRQSLMLHSCAQGIAGNIEIVSQDQIGRFDSLNPDTTIVFSFSPGVPMLSMFKTSIELA